MTLRTLALGLALGAGLYGFWQIGAVAVLHGKALLAPHLISSAWAKTLASRQIEKPWPWADTWPVAYVRWDDTDAAYPVLAGAGGNSLAFAPGHLSGSASAGKPGLMVIAGHRDTHFAHLGEVALEARFSIQSSDGVWHAYEVTDTAIVRADGRALLDPDRSRIVFVTCWPFDTTATNSPLRYAVFAERLSVPVQADGINLADPSAPSQ